VASAFYYANTTLDGALRSWAHRWSRAVAVVVADGPVQRTRTYAELDERADAVAAELVRRGVRPGDRVATAARNHICLPEIYFGILRAGGQIVPVNFRYTVAEAQRAVAATSPVAAVCEAGLVDAVAAFEKAAVEVVATLDDDDVVHWTGSGMPAAAATGTSQSSEPHMVLFTSGTTGPSKGIVQTHEAYLAQTSLPVFADDGCRPDDRVLCMYSLFHSSGWRTCLLAWQGGATAHILRHAGADAVAAALVDDDVSIVMALPDTLRSVAARLRQQRRRPIRLRALNTGTEHITASDVTSWLEAFGVPAIRVHYGASEMGPVSVARAVGRGDPVSSVGRPWPGVEVRVADPDSGEVLATGQVGEVQVRSPYLMAGYLDAPELTAAKVRDGWYLTADLGHLDAGGRLYLDGRLSDTIRSGGESIYPAEVEAVIATVDGVRDVAVVGVADERWTQRPVAFVEAAGEGSVDAGAIDEACRASLAAYKRPDRIVVVPALPRVGATDKVDRTQLRVLAERQRDALVGHARGGSYVDR
jgi:acyl-CoA synthetase (AMP-forming)/AMP-acid ligase II